MARGRGNAKASSRNTDLGTVRMGWKLKLLGVMNVVGWVIVVPVLMASLLHPFVRFKHWSGGFLLDQPTQQAHLAPHHERSKPSQSERSTLARPRTKPAHATTGEPGALPATIGPAAVAPGAVRRAPSGTSPVLVIRPQAGANGVVVVDGTGAGTPNRGGAALPTV